MQPQPAPSTAARHSRHLYFDSDVAEKLERVAQPVRDAFEHRAGERPTVVTERQAHERAARIRIRVAQLRGQGRLVIGGRGLMWIRPARGDGEARQLVTGRASMRRRVAASRATGIVRMPDDDPFGLELDLDRELE